MRCSHCGRKWTLDTNTTATCSNCQGIAQPENMLEGLTLVFQYKDKKALCDGNILYSIFLDVAPLLKADQNRLKNLIEVKGHIKLLEHPERAEQLTAEICRDLEELYSMMPDKAHSLCEDFLIASGGKKISPPTVSPTKDTKSSHYHLKKEQIIEAETKIRRDPLPSAKKVGFDTAPTPPPVEPSQPKPRPVPKAPQQRKKLTSNEIHNKARFHCALSLLFLFLITSAIDSLGISSMAIVGLDAAVLAFYTGRRLSDTKHDYSAYQPNDGYQILNSCCLFVLFIGAFVIVVGTNINMYLGNLFLLLGGFIVNFLWIRHILPRAVAKNHRTSQTKG